MRRQKLIGFVFSSLHLSVFISFFNIFWTHLFLCLFHPQLLPVPAPGGRRSLEDQTELLGVTAARGKRLTPCLQLILSCHTHINSFLVKVIAAVKVALFCGFSSGINISSSFLSTITKKCDCVDSVMHYIARSIPSSVFTHI